MEIEATTRERKCSCGRVCVRLIEKKRKELRPDRTSADHYRIFLISPGNSHAELLPFSHLSNYRSSLAAGGLGSPPRHFEVEVANCWKCLPPALIIGKGGGRERKGMSSIFSAAKRQGNEEGGRDIKNPTKLTNPIFSFFSLPFPSR